MIKTKCVCLIMLSTVAACQQSSNSTTIQAPNQTVVVTGTFDLSPLAEVNRSVSSIDLTSGFRDLSAPVEGLKTDSSVDVEERAPGGVQGDLSIRGSSFEQALVMVNGFRVDDAQSGHHNLDIAIPLNALAGIEVLHGAGSTLFGSDAVGGAVNFVTAPVTSDQVSVVLGGGNFGVNEQSVTGSFLRGWGSERAAFSRGSSDGFTADRDYETYAGSSETRFDSWAGKSDLILGSADRSFGANQFYGDFDSWERTKVWFAAASDVVGATTFGFGYRRHSDEFVLLRENPSFYENNHVSESWQATVRHSTEIGRYGRIAYGLEGDGDQITSSNLGDHARQRLAMYGNWDGSWQRFTYSLGGREEVFSGGTQEFSPSVTVGVWLRKGWRLRGSVGRAFRLPTYTDLYYHDPANIGNPFLKPESAWSFEAGPEWNAGGRVNAQATVFYRRDRNDIDYTRSSMMSPWQAANVAQVGFVGAEVSVTVHTLSSSELNVGYTLITADERVPAGITSEYVFNYPAHNAEVSWVGEWKDRVRLRTRVGAIQRVGADPYGVWDISATGVGRIVQPYVRFGNVTNTQYQEISGVPMPGRSVVGGLQFVFGRERL